jgi:histidinol-phosphatase (PHP family)
VSSIVIITSIIITIVIYYRKMPFSHHSHSGQFCPGHARNALEEMLRTALAKRMSVFALTEHMPRHEVDFYPEETAAGNTFAGHLANEREYFAEAVRLREKYKGQIGVLVGFETDWIRAGSLELIERSLGEYGFDFLVGSVHHVHTVPIDYSAEEYGRARREGSGGSEERLFEDYFDAQFEMLRAVRPPVVGHLDLIRLMSKEPDGRLGRWKGVWERVLRNLDFIRGYGGLVELNFSAVRKGLREPYPAAEVCRAFLERGGRFCVSDDSHGVEQVGTNYHKLLPFLEEVGIEEIHFLGRTEERREKPHDVRFPHLVVQAISVDDLKEHPFWSVDGNSRKP